ncbi:hypothetical protein BSZ14_09085 [Sphingomonas sp. Sph1(2015)]|jgi:hypothetical protein|uniref:hypothetical protein n=1 Tax=Sphingomonas sp. Sph1(2015) TaxID=1628084 RepID=UPI0009769D3B|nr:hypothetical protein [Sphingomonas sp. Sph1(2015)]OMJ32312.1 hypothetical protein BSZ14_09085 [Sphingomonas sp. Sph1(2015)]
MAEQEKPTVKLTASNRGDSGEVYHRDDEHALGRDLPTGQVAPKPPAPGDRNAGTSLPDDNGRRASADPKTGEVHGSGAGAGDGNPGDEIGEVDPATPPGVGPRPVN